MYIFSSIHFREYMNNIIVPINHEAEEDGKIELSNITNAKRQVLTPNSSKNCVYMKIDQFNTSRRS